MRIHLPDLNVTVSLPDSLSQEEAESFINETYYGGGAKKPAEPDTPPTRHGPAAGPGTPETEMYEATAGTTGAETLAGAGAAAMELGMFPIRAAGDLAILGRDRSRAVVEGYPGVEGEVPGVPMEQKLAESERFNQALSSFKYGMTSAGTAPHDPEMGFMPTEGMQEAELGASLPYLPFSAAAQYVGGKVGEATGDPFLAKLAEYASFLGVAKGTHKLAYLYGTRRLKKIEKNLLRIDELSEIAAKERERLKQQELDKAFDEAIEEDSKRDHVEDQYEQAWLNYGRRLAEEQKAEYEAKWRKEQDAGVEDWNRQAAEGETALRGQMVDRALSGWEEIPGAPETGGPGVHLPGEGGLMEIEAGREVPAPRALPAPRELRALPPAEEPGVYEQAAGGRPGTQVRPEKPKPKKKGKEPEQPKREFVAPKSSIEEKLRAERLAREQAEGEAPQEPKSWMQNIREFRKSFGKAAHDFIAGKRKEPPAGVRLAVKVGRKVYPIEGAEKSFADVYQRLGKDKKAVAAVKGGQAKNGYVLSTGEFVEVPGVVKGGVEAFLHKEIVKSAVKAGLPVPEGIKREAGLLKDRRKNLAKRKRVSEMSEEELRREIYTDPLTRLPNRRALEDSEPAPYQARVDMDGLKAINDAKGHEAGDKAIQALGEELRGLTRDEHHPMDVYRISGDEFVVTGVVPEILERRLAEVQAKLEAEGHPGFSYGVGENYESAEGGLRASKAERLKTGKRGKRGEPPAVAAESGGWGSKKAEDMYRVATTMANFDAKELMVEIHRLSPGGAKIKESTVLQAMQNVKDVRKAVLEASELQPGAEVPNAQAGLSIRELRKGPGDRLQEPGAYLAPENTSAARVSVPGEDGKPLRVNKATGEYYGGGSSHQTEVELKANVKRGLRNLTEMMEKNPQAAYWYERVGQMVRELARLEKKPDGTWGGDLEKAEQILRLITLYAADNSVPANATALVKSMYQLSRGENVEAGRYPNVTGRISKDLLARDLITPGTKGYSSKLRSFYLNMLDATVGGDSRAVTIDVHMLRWMDYLDTTGKAADSIEGPGYKLAREVIVRITDEYNRKTGSNLSPRQVQAALWDYQRSGRQAVPGARHTDYAEHLHEGHVTGEVIPSSKSGIVSPVEGEKEAFTRDLLKVTTGEEGQDLIAEKLGVPLYRQNIGEGLYEKKASPTVVSSLTREGTKTRGLDTKKLDAYADLWGYIYSQDAVPWYNTAFGNSVPKGAKTSGVAIRIATPKGESAFLEALPKEVQDAAREIFSRYDMGYTARQGRIETLNFEGAPDAEFLRKVSNAVQELADRFDYKFDMEGFKAESGYREGEWGGGRNGEGYLERLEQAGFGHLLEWARDRRQAAIDAASEFGSKRRAAPEPRAAEPTAAPQPRGGYETPLADKLIAKYGQPSAAEIRNGWKVAFIDQKGRYISRGPDDLIHPDLLDGVNAFEGKTWGDVSGVINENGLIRVSPGSDFSGTVSIGIEVPGVLTRQQIQAVARLVRDKFQARGISAHGYMERQVRFEDASTGDYIDANTLGEGMRWMEEKIDTGLTQQILDVSQRGAEIEGDYPTKGGMAIFPWKRQPLRSPSLVSSTDPKVEANWQASRGIGKAPLLARIKADLEKAVHEFTRARPDLNPKTDGQVIDILRRGDEISHYSKKTAYEAVKGILAGFGEDKVQAFEKAVILPDLIREAEKGAYQQGYPFEYRSIADMKADLAKVQQVLQANPDVQAAVQRRNKLFNAIRDELIARDLLPDTVASAEEYFHHQVLEHYRLRDMVTPGVSGKSVRVGKKGFQIKREGSPLNYNTKYMESEFEVIAHAMYVIEKHKMLEELKAATDISHTIQGGKIPSGYVEWQPQPGNKLYLTPSITEAVLDQLAAFTRTVEKRGVEHWIVGQGSKPRKVGEHLGVGPKRETWVIPENVARAFDKFIEKPEDSVIGKLSSNLMSSWKQWTLLNPFRVVKYNLNNMSGDFDVAFAYNPRIMRYAPNAARELWQHQMRGKALSGTLHDAIRDGVVGTGLTIKEIPDLGTEGIMALVSGDKPSLVGTYWKGVREFTVWRENVLRYAAYKFFLDELSQGKKLYGASRRSEVDALPGLKAKAAKLSRELIGDYGNVSHGGQWIRRHAIPFYSWMEVNAPRYVRMLKNARYEERGAGVTGRSALVTAKKTGTIAAKAAALYALVNVYNHVMFPDLERELTDAQRGQLHLILGRGEDGRVKTMRFQGALSDALSFFGLEDLPEDIRQIQEGTKTGLELAAEAVKAPVNKLWQALRPEKSLMETISGRTTYPNLFDEGTSFEIATRPIKDRGESAARTLSLGDVYRLGAGLPMRGGDTGGKVSEIAKSFLAYNVDPGEAAYNDTRSTVIRFLKKHGIDVPSSDLSDRAKALYYWRQAKKYGDKDAEARYYQEYLDLGGKPSNVSASIKRAHPTSMIPPRLRSQFYESLTAGQREKMMRAEEWYKRTFRD